jgi:hypothetical protein
MSAGNLESWQIIQIVARILARPYKIDPLGYLIARREEASPRMLYIDSILQTIIGNLVEHIAAKEHALNLWEA